jgi:hypothetical protein
MVLRLGRVLGFFAAFGATMAAGGQLALWVSGLAPQEVLVLGSVAAEALVVDLVICSLVGLVGAVAVAERLVGSPRVLAVAVVVTLGQVLLEARSSLGD